MREYQIAVEIAAKSAEDSCALFPKGATPQVYKNVDHEKDNGKHPLHYWRRLLVLDFSVKSADEVEERSQKSRKQTVKTPEDAVSQVVRSEVNPG